MPPGSPVRQLATCRQTLRGPRDGRELHAPTRDLRRNLLARGSASSLTRARAWPAGTNITKWRPGPLSDELIFFYCVCPRFRFRDRNGSWLLKAVRPLTLLSSVAFSMVHACVKALKRVPRTARSGGVRASLPLSLSLSFIIIRSRLHTGNPACTLLFSHTSHIHTNAFELLIKTVLTFEPSRPNGQSQRAQRPPQTRPSTQTRHSGCF